MKPAVSNPFLGVEHLLAADIPAVTFKHTHHGLACFVKLRGMDASASERFQAATWLTSEQIKDAGSAPNTDGLQVELLVSTVVDFQFAFLQETSDGKTATHTPRGKDLDEETRRDIFAGLEPEFRRGLVRACCEVNGIDPLSVGVLASPGRTPVSEPPSEPPPPSTGTSEPAKAPGG